MDAWGLLIAAKSLSSSNKKSEKFLNADKRHYRDDVIATPLLTILLGMLAAYYNWQFNTDLHVPVFEKVVSAVAAFLFGLTYFVFNALFGHGVSALSARIHTLELKSRK